MVFAVVLAVEPNATLFTHAPIPRGNPSVAYAPSGSFTSSSETSSLVTSVSGVEEGVSSSKIIPDLLLLTRSPGRHHLRIGDASRGRLFLGCLKGYLCFQKVYLFKNRTHHIKLVFDSVFVVLAEYLDVEEGYGHSWIIKDHVPFPQ